MTDLESNPPREAIHVRPKNDEFKAVECSGMCKTNVFQRVADQLVLSKIILKSWRILKRLKKLEQLESTAISTSTLT